MARHLSEALVILAEAKDPRVRGAAGEMLQQAPSFTVEDAERVAREYYGRSGRASPLTSERDQNFLIDGGLGDGIVLKIANALEDRALLEAQQHVLALLAQRQVPAPRVVCTIRGEALIEIADTYGTRHLVWAVNYLPGILLAEVAHRPAALLEDLGGTIGRLTAAMLDVQHPALDREFHWDLTHAAERVAATRAAIG